MAGYQSFRPGYLAPYYRTRNIVFKAVFFFFGLWLKERRILQLNALVLLSGLYNEEYSKPAYRMRKTRNRGEMTGYRMATAGKSYSVVFV